MINFYHGTSLEHAQELMTLKLTPMTVPQYSSLGWYDYTDFGKGFYTFPEGNKRMSLEWAKKKHGQRWGVVRFSLTQEEYLGIPGRNLTFLNKRMNRPSNAPVLFDSKPATWIEFVEYNRGIRKSVMRPGDNDWTAHYPWMRGPLWGRADSKMPGGGPPVPEHIHQINWGRAGLAALNTEAAKKRRFLFTKDNEGDYDRKFGPSWIHDDDQVRSWVNTHSASDISGLSTAQKLLAINSLMSGWISDEDVAAIAKICGSVILKTEASTIRGKVNLLSMTSIGQRTAVRAALARMP